MPCTPTRRGAVAAWILSIATFVLVLTIRWDWIISFGSSLGFWDQWDSEAARLLKPYEEGALQAEHLLAAHNEHRIVLHRLWLLFAQALNAGQWDNIVAAFGITLLWAGFLATMVIIWSRRLATCWALPVLAVLLAINTFAYAWESLTVSLQTAFLQLIALTTVSICLASGERLGRARAAACILLCILSMGTLASSLLTPLATGAAILLRWWTTRRETALSVTTICMLVAVAVAGLAAMVTIPAHLPLRSDSQGEFLSAWGVALAWPLGTSWPIATILWLPWSILLVRIVVRNTSLSPHLAHADRMFAALGLWVIAQAAAVAFSRGHAMNELGTRYAETIAVGLVVNTHSAWSLAHALRRRSLWRWVSITTAMLFTLTQLAALNHFTQKVRPIVDQRAQQYRTQQLHVADFINTGNRDALWGQARLDIPYPIPGRLAMLLDDPTIRSILPAVVRPRRILCNALAEPEGTHLLHFPPSTCDASLAALRALDVVRGGDLPECTDAQFQHDGLRLATRFNPAIGAAMIARCHADPALTAVAVAPLGPISALLGSWRAPLKIPALP